MIGEVRVHLAGAAYHYTPKAGGSSESPDIFIIGPVSFEIDRERLELARTRGSRTTHAFAVGQVVTIVDPASFDDVFDEIAWRPFNYDRPASGIFRLRDTGEAIVGAELALFRSYPGGYGAWVADPVISSE